ncbi:MAG: hypothetical protein NVSMB45_16210 [Ginsengibacter sp.]
MDKRKKILLVQLYANGDCLYTTTIARQIKVDYPGAHLTWAISDSCQNIIQYNPDVDHILPISNVQRNSDKYFRKFKKEVESGKYGIYDEIFIPQVADANLANYDGTIRSAIFRGYPNKITVPVEPVLILSDEEKLKVDKFAVENKLSDFSHVILFEYAPLSGQSKMTFLTAMSIAKSLTLDKTTAVILSSANKFENDDPNIIDGSILSIRETAHLTHYCNFMMGCSSGLTWVATSSAAKKLPMVQILDPKAIFINPVSRDFHRFNISNPGLIEITQFSENIIIECVLSALKDFPSAIKNFNGKIPLSFRASRMVVFNLLTQRNFKAIKKHIAVNIGQYGFKFNLLKHVAIGFFQFPFKATTKYLHKKK